MQYRTLIDVYLTFLTHNDSYMEKVPVGTILALSDGNLCYKGRASTDNHKDFEYHNMIKEWTANPIGDGSGLENLRASDPSL